MPPFRLELPDRKPTHWRSIKIIFPKNVYSENVKVEGWEHRLFAKPIDFNPFCPGAVDHFRSHYNRFGMDDTNRFTTTTGDTLEDVFKKRTPIMLPNKHMSTYYSYDDSIECRSPFREPECPDFCACDYVTSMQHSYRVPHPYKMQRLAFPKVPFMQNQKYKNDEPRASSCKFYDESFQKGTMELQKHKGFRYKSYNFMTGESQ